MRLCVRRRRGGLEVAFLGVEEFVFLGVVWTWHGAFWSYGVNAGMARRMNSSNRGTVKAMSPWAGL